MNRSQLLVACLIIIYFTVVKINDAAVSQCFVGKGMGRITNCPSTISANFCRTSLGPGSVVYKSCVVSCTNNQTTSCCNTTNCNADVDFCMTGVGAGVSLQCPSGSVYCVTSQVGSNVVKYCGSTCISNSTTSCCNYTNCNTDVLQCYSGTGNVSNIANCSTGNVFCRTDISTGNVVRSCSTVCISSSTTSCCSEDNCNENIPILSCYVGTGTGRITSCPVSSTACQTEFFFANGTTVKSCADTCQPSLTNTSMVLCCDTYNGTNCNSRTIGFTS